jgi:mono/diheme cytochrome c family protein
MSARSRLRVLTGPGTRTIGGALSRALGLAMRGAHPLTRLRAFAGPGARTIGGTVPRALGLAMLGALAIGGALPLADAHSAPPPARPSPAAGKAVFEKRCAACHAADPKLAGTLALQTKYGGEIPAALEQRTDLTPETVALFVRNGVAWMAPYRKTEISDAELADLGAYLSQPPARQKGRSQ